MEPVSISSLTRSELDLRDQRAVYGWFEHNRPELVCHAPGTVGGIVASDTRGAEFIHDNSMLAANFFIDAADKSGVRRLPYLGRFCVHRRHHWSRPQKWANLAFGWLEWVTWGRRRLEITDPINGYRAITVYAWDLLSPDVPGYTEYPTSIRACKHGFNIDEFPTREGRRIGGESKVKSISTGPRFETVFDRTLLMTGS